MTSDLRVFAWHRLSSVPLSQLIAFCCPRMFALCDWSEVEGTVDGNECVVLPATLPLSSASMTQDGAFLVENGESMLLWIGKWALQGKQTPPGEGRGIAETRVSLSGLFRRADLCRQVGWWPSSVSPRSSSFIQKPLLRLSGKQPTPWERGRWQWCESFSGNACSQT